MINFYNEADNLLYKQPNSQFITQDRFRGDVAPNPEEIEEVTETFGIPATEVYRNNGGGNGGGGNFNSSISNQPYTANLNQGQFVTNRTAYGNSGYLPGTEPEETFMDKMGGYIKTGIGAVVPGGNFLMGMAGKLDNFKNLSAQDKAFIEMQMGNQEQSMYGGNLANQDRYGYNKRSMKGNYSNVVADRVEIANQRKADGKDLRDIDLYYLEKEKEEENVKNQIEFNNFVRQRGLANKIREGIKKGTIKEDFNVHGGDGKNDITTGAATTTGDGQGHVQSSGTYDTDTSTGGSGDHRTSSNMGSTQHGSSGMTKDQHSAFRGNKGGRVGYFFGGLAARGMKR